MTIDELKKLLEEGKITKEQFDRLFIPGSGCNYMG